MADGFKKETLANEPVSRDYDSNEIVDYVFGDLSPEQATNFEVRMKQDRSLRMFVEIMEGFVPGK